MSQRPPSSRRKNRTILSQKSELSKDPANRTSTAAHKPALSSTLKKKPAYLKSLNESEKEANFKIIDNMSKRISFLRNPRFKSNKCPVTLNKAAGTILSLDQEKAQCFTVEPKVVSFADYQINGVYEIQLKITNRSGHSQRLKHLPPRTEHFSIKSVKLPNKEEGLVAPGMSVLMAIVFKAPSFADFDD